MWCDRFFGGGAELTVCFWRRVAVKQKTMSLPRVTLNPNQQRSSSLLGLS